MAAINLPQCVLGEEALSRAAWTEALHAFETALQVKESAETLEGLGHAAWWLDRAELVFDSRERAYRLYLASHQPVAAARVAVWLGWDYWAFRGESAVANGWLQRARRLLQSEPTSAEHAWLDIREASFCLLEYGDPERAQTLSNEGIRKAREVGNVDLEMLGVAVQGLVLVMAGSVREGMCCLDEVNTAVIAGELTDRVAIGLAGCYLISACERVRDYERVLQWCTRLKAYCAEWGLRPLFAVCRTQYASICLWRGTWLEAEEELRHAAEELAPSRPAMTGEAWIKLGELRRRQGRLAEAEMLFQQCPPHGASLLGRAELAMDRGDAPCAAEHTERYLRQLPAANRMDRAAGLELLVRALCGTGDHERGCVSLAELSSIAETVSTTPMRASMRFAAGCLAAARDELDKAKHCFEDAVDLYIQSGAPFETGRARLELARCLRKLGRNAAAVEEAQQAMSLFKALSAEFEIARVRQFLDTSVAAPARQDEIGSPCGKGELTPREMEVLRMVGEGLNNQCIAKLLFLSEHTVHRHVANILNKLNVSTRAAAVAQAARRGIIS